MSQDKAMLRALQKLQLRGYVITRGSKADQEMANRYYHFCNKSNFTWVQIKPKRKVSWIRVELFGAVQRLDEQAKEELRVLLRHPKATDYNVIPTLTHVPNDSAEQTALELLRICEANRKRAETSSSPAEKI